MGPAATALFLAHCAPLLHHPRRRLLLPTSAATADSSSSSSYLDMWRKAVDRERRSLEFNRLAENTASTSTWPQPQPDLAAQTERFNDILSVPKSERDRVQSLQVIDRAAAAIAAAKALLRETNALKSGDDASLHLDDDDSSLQTEQTTELEGRHSSNYVPETLNFGTPGPDFWSWSPQSDVETNSGDDTTGVKRSEERIQKSYMLIEKERSNDILSLPFESLLETDHIPSLPPLQSLLEHKTAQSDSSDLSAAADEVNLLFSRKAAEAAEVLSNSTDTAPRGIRQDGTKWWKETGTEQREDGVVCKWTVVRGYSANGSVEWEDKYWESADQFDYKELGSEKSGRDAAGNVWREFWKESMWQDISSGLTQMEKTADKWGKSCNGVEWHEKWSECYDSSGNAEKWAHKWCSTDKNKELDPGHAHVWHERWGEKYDGKGASMKYTDKWAERFEGDGWSKWGDKWDEHFDTYGHGVKQGESWWKGKHGEEWNRTWGEGHNGSGWVHKYGKSSSGEHWDTHVQEETWYERFPHFGFDHCFLNSVQLRSVPKHNAES